MGKQSYLVCAVDQITKNYAVSDLICMTIYFTCVQVRSFRDSIRLMYIPPTTLICRHRSGWQPASSLHAAVGWRLCKY